MEVEVQPGDASTLEETPVSTVFCFAPPPGNLADEAMVRVVRRHMRDAFGPFVNIVRIGWGSDGLGRGGLTSRTVFELNHCGHGVVFCGTADTLREEVPRVDAPALEALDLPLLGVGWGGRAGFDVDGRARLNVLGLPDATAAAMSRRAGLILARDSRVVDAVTALGGRHVQNTGCPTLALEPAPLAWEAASPDSGVLLSVRDPARMVMPASRRADFVSALRDLLVVLRKQVHPVVRLLCHDAADLAFCASMSRADFLYCDELDTWIDRVRHARLHISLRDDATRLCAALAVPCVPVVCGSDERRALAATGLGAAAVELDAESGFGTLNAQVLEAARASSARWDGARLEASVEWEAQERLTASGFRRFARAVRARRGEDPHRRQVDAGG